jgi:hypothetical protein
VAWTILQQFASVLNSVSPTTATPSQAYTAGSKLIVCYALNDQGGPGTLTVKDAAGNSFTQVFHQNEVASGDGDLYLYVEDTPAGIVGTSGAITATDSVTDDITIVVLEVAGLQAGTSGDGTPGGTSGSASPATTGSYSSAAASEFLICLIGTTGANTYTTPGGWNASTANLSNGNSGNASIFYKNSTGGSESASITLGGTVAQWGTILVAYKVTAAAAVPAGTQAVPPGWQSPPAFGAPRYVPVPSEGPLPYTRVDPQPPPPLIPPGLQSPMAAGLPSVLHWVPPEGPLPAVTIPVLPPPGVRARPLRGLPPPRGHQAQVPPTQDFPLAFTHTRPSFRGPPLYSRTRYLSPPLVTSAPTAPAWPPPNHLAGPVLRRGLPRRGRMAWPVAAQDIIVQEIRTRPRFLGWPRRGTVRQPVQPQQQGAVPPPWPPPNRLALQVLRRGLPRRGRAAVTVPSQEQPLTHTHWYRLGFPTRWHRAEIAAPQFNPPRVPDLIHPARPRFVRQWWRGRGSWPPPAQVAAGPPPYPVTSFRARVRPPLRRAGRAFAPVPPQDQPISHTLWRRTGLPRRGRQVTPVPPQLNPPKVPDYTHPARTRMTRQWVRGRAAAPVPPQDQIPGALARERTRVLGLPRRGRVASTPQAQAAAAPPPYPPQTSKHRVFFRAPARSRIAWPVQTQQAAAPPPWPPDRPHLRARLILPRRAALRAPVPPQDAPAPVARPRLRAPWRRPGRGAQAPIQPPALPPPGRARPQPRIGLPARRRAHDAAPARPVFVGPPYPAERPKSRLRTFLQWLRRGRRFSPGLGQAIPTVVPTGPLWAVRTSAPAWDAEPAATAWRLDVVPAAWLSEAVAAPWTATPARLDWRTAMPVPFSLSTRVFEPIAAISDELVNALWTSDLGGVTTNPTTLPMPVQFAFPPSSGNLLAPAEPVSWFSGAWVSPTGAYKGYIAQIMVGPGIGVVTLTAGQTYDVWSWVNTGSGQENPKKFVGQLAVY